MCLPIYSRTILVYSCRSIVFSYFKSMLDTEYEIKICSGLPSEQDNLNGGIFAVFVDAKLVAGASAAVIKKLQEICMPAAFFYAVLQNEVRDFIHEYDACKVQVFPVPSNRVVLETVLRPFKKMQTAGSGIRDLKRFPSIMSSDVSAIDDMIGSSECMMEIKHALAFFADKDIPTLILGETGSGKSFAAGMMHRLSGRPAEKFCRIAMTAVPGQIAESELFGTERGAFTSAVSREGLFENSDGGTVLLDEIGDADAAAQAKLLNFLDTGTFRRLGSVKEHAINVKLIFATNRNLEELVAKGLFRKDLYHRINGLRIHIPPLREHKEDIPALSAAAAKKYNKVIPPRTAAFLEDYDWPGNIRELSVCIKRSCLLSRDRVIEPQDILLQ